nr:YlxR family protein [Nocardioides panacisoli]
MTAEPAEDGGAVVLPDPSGTAPGRGAHLHPTTECYDLAVRRKAFPRALRLAGGSSSAPVGEHLAARPVPDHHSSDRPTQNRSSSS